jgi:hypothetical protein
MNEEEQQRFEEQLGRFPPARLPEQLMARILAAKPCVQSRPKIQSRQLAGLPDWFRALRWLAPAAAAAVILVGVARHERTPAREALEPRHESGDVAARGAAAPIRADDAEVDQKLESSYDVVAQLPSGVPIRFRVEKWRDEVVLQDTNRGLIVAQTMPRWEVAPVRFETY